MCVPSIYKAAPFLKKEGLPRVALLSTGGAEQSLIYKERILRKYERDLHTKKLQ